MAVPVVVIVGMVVIVGVVVRMIMAVSVVVVVRMPVPMVIVRMGLAPGRSPPLPAQPVEHAQAQHADPDSDDEERGDQVHPRVELLGNDELGERERDQPEREDADRVRDRHDPAQVQRVAGGTTGSDEIRGDDRLAVARAERVGRAPEHREEQRDDDDAGAQVLLRDQAGETALGLLS